MFNRIAAYDDIPSNYRRNNPFSSEASIGLMQMERYHSFSTSSTKRSQELDAVR